MMGRLKHDQEQFLYSFRLDEAVPADHPVRRIAAVLDLSWVYSELAPYYPPIGRPSIDPVLMIRMLIVGYAFGIRSERVLCRELAVNLAYRWFCGLSIEDKIPDHSAFSRARHERFRESDLLRQVFERVVETCIAAGLVGGEGFAVDASLIVADANKQRSRSTTSPSEKTAPLAGKTSASTRSKTYTSARSARFCAQPASWPLMERHSTTGHAYAIAAAALYSAALSLTLTPQDLHALDAAHPSLSRFEYWAQPRLARPSKSRLVKLTVRSGCLHHRRALATCTWRSTGFALPLARAPVAQLDRAPDFESGGQGFESLPARQ